MEAVPCRDREREQERERDEGEEELGLESPLSRFLRFFLPVLFLPSPLFLDMFSGEEGSEGSLLSLRKGLLLSSLKSSGMSPHRGAKETEAEVYLQVLARERAWRSAAAEVRLD